MQVAQFRYYGEKDSRNYPALLNKSDLCTGNTFNAYYPLTRFVIKGTNGIEFQVNDEASTIKIGDVEHYECEKDNITSLRFNNGASYTTTSLDQIFDSETKPVREPYLFIDIYY